jgi:2-methylisocitrate lyase-like PEP mutase family enzyme
MEEIARATPGLVRVANMIEAGRTPLLTPKELHDLGFDLIVSPLTGLFASARALANAYGVLRVKGSLRDDLDLLTDFPAFNEVVDLQRHYGLEATYAEGDPEGAPGG